MIDPDAGPPPDVSIVIRTFNESETLPRCIEGLRTQATPRRVELIVVDSGSTDGTPALARRLGAHVYAVPQAAFNYGGALNLAPIPVPGAVWLFGSALAGLAWLRRRAT